jgi:hypothetical protein
MTTATPLSETLAELNDLCRIVTTAESQLKEGRLLDLSGVDSRVSAICKTVQASLPEQQQEYLPELTILINLLDSTKKLCAICKLR